jgi:hypothetical protein
MATPKTQKLGSRKEAQLAIVEESAVAQRSPQKQVYTPEDAEFDHFSKLLTGFFEKISRWQETAQTQGYTYFDNSDFSVFRSGNGFIIAPGTSLSDLFIREKQPNPQDRILDVSIVVSERPLPLFLTHPQPTDIDVFIWPGEAGKQLFTDPEGKPLKDVSIKIYDGKNWEFNRPDERGKVYTGLRISAAYPSDLYPTVGCEYKLYKPTKTLIIHQEMPEFYQNHLFNMIDVIIPGNTSPTPRLERRASTEIPAPKALPPGRRPVGR